MLDHSITKSGKCFASLIVTDAISTVAVVVAAPVTVAPAVVVIALCCYCQHNRFLSSVIITVTVTIIRNFKQRWTVTPKCNNISLCAFLSIYLLWLQCLFLVGSSDVV